MTAAEHLRLTRRLALAVEVLAKAIAEPKRYSKDEILAVREQILDVERIAEVELHSQGIA